jgi:hypothetical protein
MELSPSNAANAIKKVLKVGLVPMLTGSPGTGKSDIVRNIAKEYNLELIDLRLSQCDPCDLAGFPMLNKDTEKAFYAPMNTFPLEGDPLPEGKSGWLLFLDEMNAAAMSVQAASYKLVLDREVGLHNLHENVAIVCAGNKASDNAVVSRMSTAMQSRLIHLEMGVDHEGWINWATNSGIDYRVIAYINFKPDILHNFDPNHNDKTFPTLRTWEFVSKLIKDEELMGPDYLPLLSGAVGQGAGNEFYGFTKIFQDLPNIKDIIAQGDHIRLPTEPSVFYAITGLVSHHINESNVEALMKYVVRLPIEFQVVTLQATLRTNRALLSSPSMEKWVTTNARELL